MIYLGADHNGYELKAALKKYLTHRKVAFRDLGALAYSKQDDYPDFAIAVAKKLGRKDAGILICGSGHGMAIAANKVRGARAALCQTPFSAKMARHDDHANVLVLSSWETPLSVAKLIVATWLATKPSTVTRHVRRVKKINQAER